LYLRFFRDFPFFFLISKKRHGLVTFFECRRRRKVWRRRSTDTWERLGRRAARNVYSLDYQRKISFSLPSVSRRRRL